MGKYFTIQKRSIVEQILAGEDYYPDFAKSDYPQQPGLEQLRELYDFMLEAFNNNNGTDWKGLVFVFACNYHEDVYYLGSYEEFQKYIRARKHVVKSLWNHFLEGDHVVVELDVDDSAIEPLFLDINDFQFLMPPVLALPPYTEADEERIKMLLMEGEYPQPKLQSNLVQGHLPMIKKEDITAIHPMFE